MQDMATAAVPHTHNYEGYYVRVQRWVSVCRGVRRYKLTGHSGRGGHADFDFSVEIVNGQTRATKGVRRVIEGLGITKCQQPVFLRAHCSQKYPYIFDAHCIHVVIVLGCRC